MIYKLAIKENVIVVPGGQLIDWNKALKRYNELQKAPKPK